MSMKCITALLVGIFLLVQIEDAFTKNDEALPYNWAHLDKPRTIKYVLCEMGFTVRDIDVIKKAIGAWDNPPLIKIEIDESKPCTSVNENWGKCQKINVIDIGKLEGGYNSIVSVGGAAQGCTDTNKPNNRLNCDIRINSEIERYNGAATPPAGVYDLQSILVHELGHCVGLKDNTVDKNAVMGGLRDAQVKRTPTDDEKALRDKILK